jgi:hypothetical protein
MIGAMVEGGIAGFWSYTHADDELDGGRITRLAQKIRAEFPLLTGQELEIFVDRESLAWGDAWRTRIDEALETTTFFIPIVTPRYFRRQECRRELLTFAGHAKSLGLEELLLPVLYVSVPLLTSGDVSSDEVIALIAATQWEDWRKLRLLEEDSAEYRRAVNKLATRLADVSERVATGPTPAPSVPAVPDRAETDEEPGFVDLLAAGEEAMPRWQSTIEEFPPLLETFSALAQEATNQVTLSDARGAGFAGRLAAARNLARKLDAPAERILELGRSYASDLVQIDPAILTLIRMMEEDPEEARSNEIQDLFGSIHELAAASRENARTLTEFVSTLDSTAKISRELRGPVRKIQEGLRNILDGQAVIDEWDRRVTPLRTMAPPPEPTES